MANHEIKLRKPSLEDGMDLFELVERCPPLDLNSSYCKFLQCSHFADTAVAAFKKERLVGFISGYLKPSEPNVWFVWQVAVDQEARGYGLAKRMVKSVLSRAYLANVQFIETTITPDNEASWALFRSIAKEQNAPISESIMLDETLHFKGRHKTEYLVRIGPFNASDA